MLTLNDIEQAADTLAGHAAETPLLIGQFEDIQILLKAECLQRTGSFKFRGAFNAISQLGAEAKGAGVVACSSGNHAQGVALAAQILSTTATIVMPSDAPAAKIAKTRHYGARVVLYDRDTENREEIAEEHASRTGGTLVWPYDNYHVMAGQGTCALETVQQAQARGLQIDAMLAPCSGGGLAAGVSTTMAALAPACSVYTVEPENFDDHARSFASGKRQTNAQRSGSFCDALLAPTPGQLTFPINQSLITGGLVVSDDQVREAMRFAFEEFKLVLEPGGAASLAALMHNADFAGKSIAVIASGGNVDAAIFRAAIGAQDTS